MSLQDTPLHIAAERGDLEVAKSLLAQGADVNAREVNLKVLALSTLDTLNPLLPTVAWIRLWLRFGCLIRLEMTLP